MTRNEISDLFARLLPKVPVTITELKQEAMPADMDMNSDEADAYEEIWSQLGGYLPGTFQWLIEGDFVNGYYAVKFHGSLAELERRILAEQAGIM